LEAIIKGIAANSTLKLVGFEVSCESHSKVIAFRTKYLKAS